MWTHSKNVSVSCAAAACSAVAGTPGRVSTESAISGLVVMPMPASCGDAIVAAIVDMSAVPCQFGGASCTGGMESFCAGAASGFFCSLLLSVSVSKLTACLKLNF